MGSTTFSDEPRAGSKRHPWRRRSLLALLLLLGAVIVWLMWGGQPDPVMDGRPAGAWTRDLLSGNPATQQRAKEMLEREAATVIPWLESQFRQRDTIALGFYERWGLAWPRRFRAWYLRVVRPLDATLNRQAAARALRVYDAQISAATWLIVLRDPHPSVAAVAVEVLTAKGVAAVPVLREGLRDRDTRVRSLSCGMLTALGAGASSAVPELLRLLDDPDQNLRQQVVSALGVLGVFEPAVIEGLGRALGDRDATVRRLAVVSLGRAGTRAAPLRPDLEALRADPDPRVRSNVVVVLQQLKPSPRRP